MECLAALFVLVILIGVTMTFASQAHTSAERWSRAFLGLARKYGGWYQAGGWFGRPKVRFYYNGTHVLVDTFSASRPPRRYVQIHLAFPDPQMRCEAFPRRAEARTFFGGASGAAAGAGGFDAEYAIRCDSVEQAKLFFSDGVQLQINRIRYLLGNDDVYVLVQRGQLVIKKEFPRHGGADHVEDLVSLALELYDQALLARSAGIAFLEHQTLQAIDQCVCLVCGEALLDDVVLCRRCKTPHHRECWIFFGACSTYGCREAEFVVPRVAQPASDPAGSKKSATRE